MKTLMLFDEGYGDIFFFEFDRDLSHLNNAYINSVNTPEALENELQELVYDEGGRVQLPKLDQPTRDWDVFIRCGMLP